MKKVIKNGKVPEAEDTCPICECVFVYDRKEAIFGNINSCTEGFYVHCPCCTEKLKINYQNIQLLKL